MPEEAAPRNQQVQAGQPIDFQWQGVLRFSLAVIAGFSAAASSAHVSSPAFSRNHLVMEVFFRAANSPQRAGTRMVIGFSSLLSAYVFPALFRPCEQS
jgi:hypothetical protein